jgi:hypothetical protein
MHDQRPPLGVRYAVAFREQEGPSTAGALLVSEDRLLLAGRAGDRELELSIPLAELAEIRIGRSPAERLNGGPVLVLERHRAPPVHISPFGIGLLHELADLFASLAAEQQLSGEQVAVIVPLKPGCSERAKQLVTRGPPFDPASLGLTTHEVYLSEHEVVFLFSGPHVRAKIERAMRSPALWRAGLDWRDCIAGRPRLAAASETVPTGGEPIYSWTANTKQSA